MHPRGAQSLINVVYNSTLTWANPSLVSLERQMEARSEVGRLHAVLANMDGRQAETVVLHDLFGHSVPQVAERLGINTCAARSTLRRARQEFVKRCSYTLRPCDQGP